MAWNPYDITARQISARKDQGIHPVRVELGDTILTLDSEEASQPEARKGRKTSTQKHTPGRELQKPNCIGGK